jgi:hypothetical protein
VNKALKYHRPFFVSVGLDSQPPSDSFYLIEKKLFQLLETVLRGTGKES